MLRENAVSQSQGSGALYMGGGIGWSDLKLDTSPVGSKGWKLHGDWLPPVSVFSHSTYTGMGEVFQRIGSHKARTRRLKDKHNFIKVVALSTGRLRFGREGPDGMRTAAESQFIKFLKDCWNPLTGTFTGSQLSVSVDYEYVPKTDFFPEGAEGIEMFWDEWNS